MRQPERRKRKDADINENDRGLEKAFVTDLLGKRRALRTNITRLRGIS